MNFSRSPPAILYVDDERLACKYFARVAGTEFEVLTLPGADEALAQLGAHESRIGVLVTDYRMPGRDGSDLLREVAARYPHLVCVLVTAYANKQVLLDTINSADVFRILEKPLQAAVVRDVLRLAVDLACDRRARRERLLAMNETVAFLSHELTTPLATIINYASGINRRVADAGGSPLNLTEIDGAVRSMQDNAGYCLDVLATFVASVRHEDQRLITGSSGSAGQLVSSLLHTFPLTPAQRLAIQFDVAEDFRVAVLANIVSLVLSSILHNALRALKDHAAPVLRVTVLVDRYPEIRIADNGPGIAPEVRERLMVDPVTTHGREGGRGWGLMFCNRMMQSFGGGMSIESTPGSGTMVILRFPAIKTSKDAKGAVDDGLQ
jgi:two-component system, response regulator PhcR